MATMNSNTQKQRIIDYIAREGSITTIEAFMELGITKLTTRISELRRDGYDIAGEKVVLYDSKGKAVSHFNKYTINS